MTSMGRSLFGALVIVGVVWGGLVPTAAAPVVTPGGNRPNLEALSLEHVGYWRRQYRRHGYPVPYVYYPPRMAITCLRRRTLPSTATRLATRMATIHLQMVVSTATIRPRLGMRANIRPRMVTN